MLWFFLLILSFFACCWWAVCIIILIKILFSPPKVISVTKKSLEKELDSKLQFLGIETSPLLGSIQERFQIIAGKYAFSELIKKKGG